MNAIPVYEAKNRLSYYLHLTDEQGPIFINSIAISSYTRIVSRKNLTEIVLCIM